jgi:hypothetical protein
VVYTALRWLSIPVIVREFKDALASLEALLLENASREKTIEQKVREAALWKEIEQESAKHRQGTRRDIQENFPGCGEPFGQSRDHVAKRVGLGSGKTYQKAVKVVEEIDKARFERIPCSCRSIAKCFESPECRRGFQADSKTRCTERPDFRINC